MRPHEFANERFALVNWRGNRVRELMKVLVEPLADCEQPATGAHQVIEVNGAVLVLNKFGDDNRQHGASDDACFDERAGVQPHYRGAVKDGVEVVGARVFVNRVAAPHDRVELGDIDRLPFGGWSC